VDVRLLPGSGGVRGGCDQVRPADGRAPALFVARLDRRMPLGPMLDEDGPDPAG
jgi:hypothetical protein